MLPQVDNCFSTIDFANFCCTQTPGGQGANAAPVLERGYYEDLQPQHGACIYTPGNGPYRLGPCCTVGDCGGREGCWVGDEPDSDDLHVQGEMLSEQARLAPGVYVCDTVAFVSAVVLSVPSRRPVRLPLGQVVPVAAVRMTCWNANSAKFLTATSGVELQLRDQRSALCSQK